MGDEGDSNDRPKFSVKYALLILVHRTTKGFAAFLLWTLFLLILALPLLYYAGAIYLVLWIWTTIGQIEAIWLRNILYGIEVVAAIGLTVIAQDAWYLYIWPQQKQWTKSIQKYQDVLRTSQDVPELTVKDSDLWTIWFLRACNLLGVMILLFLFYLWANSQLKGS